MTIRHILQQRLLNQQISIPQFKTPESVVKHMGAIQAQDYAISKWAVGLRMPHFFPAYDPCKWAGSRYMEAGSKKTKVVVALETAEAINAIKLKKAEQHFAGFYKPV